MIQRDAHKTALVGLADSLMDQWCRRRALRPLQVLLRAYPGPLWHAYHKMELLEAMEHLNDLFREELTEAEQDSLDRLLNLLRGSLPVSGACAENGASIAAISV